MRFPILPLVVALTICAGAASGEENPKGVIDERQLLARIERSPRLQMLRDRSAMARAEVTAARLLPNPSIEYDRESVAVEGRQRAEDFLRAIVPLDVSGRRGRRIAAAQAAAGSTAADLERERLLLTLEALDVFHAAAHARLRVGQLVRDRAGLAELVNRVRTRAAAGDAAGYDATRIELELGEHDDLTVGAQRELSILRRSLGLLLDDGPLDADDALEIPSVAPSAQAARGDLRAARLRLAQGQAELDAGRRGWVPLLELSGGWKSVDLGATRATGFLAGVSARVPLFDHGQAERARGEARRRLAEAEIRLLERGIPVAVTIARDGLAQISAQASAYQTAQVLRADTLLRRAEGLYREGERPVFELIDVLRTTRQVRLRALALRLEAKRAEVELWRALGTRSRP